MSKAELLTFFLAAGSDRVTLTIRQVEVLLGHPLPPEARGNEAWWRDSDETNEVIAAMKAAGINTSNVTLDGDKIEMERAKYGVDSEGRPRRRHPLFGAFRTKIDLPPDLDLTEPTDPEWGKLNAD